MRRHQNGGLLLTQNPISGGGLMGLFCARRRISSFASPTLSLFSLLSRVSFASCERPAVARLRYAVFLRLRPIFCLSIRTRAPPLAIYPHGSAFFFRRFLAMPFLGIIVGVSEVPLRSYLQGPRCGLGPRGSPRLLQLIVGGPSWPWRPGRSTFQSRVPATRLL